MTAIYAYYESLRWITSNLVIFYLDGQEGKDFNIYRYSTDVASNDRCLEKEKDVNLEKERISYGPIDERERMRTEHPEVFFSFNQVQNENTLGLQIV